jgi:ATP-binding cassette subfamily C protein
VTDSYTFATLFRQIRAEKKDFWRTNLYGILATACLLPIPMLIPLLIDEVLLGHPGRMTAAVFRVFGTTPDWFNIALVLAAILCLRFIAFFLQNRQTFFSTRLSQKISCQLRKQILNHLERVSLAEYETLKSGGIAAKTIQDVQSISVFASQLVTTLLSATLMLTGIALVMLWMNWLLALLVFMLNPLFLGFSRILGRKTGKLMLRQHEAYQLYQELLNETMELFTQVRASNQERSFFNILRQRAEDIEQTSLDYGYRAAVANSSSSLLTSTVVDLFRALGIGAVVYSDLSIGMMIAFLFYLSTLVTPTQQLMGLVIGYQNCKPAMTRVNSLLSLVREPDYPCELNPFAGQGTTSVELQNISFAYANGKPVLHSISLKAEAGQKIALIGTSGSGKSTLAQIMVGFYPSHSGAILYGGAPIERIGLPVVRQNVALMLQQTLFFNDTIRMNLSLSADRNDQEIYTALQAALLADFVQQLPEGLDTLIGKNGIRLSGGQRQRLAIARLVLSDPGIVIFDEATSALDNSTEFHLYEALAPFLEGRTTIIIAHRTTTIKQADYVYLIEEGRAVAEGSYSALQKQGLIKDNFDVS